MFDQLVDTLIRPYVPKKITQEQLDKFEECWTLYLLGDRRYGQAFCEHFNLNIHTPLYHFNDEVIARRWIIENYT